MAETLSESRLQAMAEAEIGSVAIEGGWICGGCGSNHPMTSAHCACLSGAIKARIAPGAHGRLSIDYDIQAVNQSAVTIPPPATGNPVDDALTERKSKEPERIKCRALVVEKTKRSFDCTLIATDCGHVIAKKVSAWDLAGVVVLGPRVDRLHKRNAENAIESFRQELGIASREWEPSEIVLPGGAVVQAEPVE